MGLKVYLIFFALQNTFAMFGYGNRKNWGKENNEEKYKKEKIDLKLINYFIYFLKFIWFIFLYYI